MYFIGWFVAFCVGIIEYSPIWICAVIGYIILCNIITPKNKTGDKAVRITVFAVSSLIIYIILILNFLWPQMFKTQYHVVELWQLSFLVPLTALAFFYEIYVIVLKRKPLKMAAIVMISFITAVPLIVSVAIHFNDQSEIYKQVDESRTLFGKEAQEYLSKKYPGITFVQKRVEGGSYKVTAKYTAGDDSLLEYTVEKENGEIYDNFDERIYNDRQTLFEILKSTRTQYQSHCYLYYQPIMRKESSNRETDLELPVFLKTKTPNMDDELRKDYELFKAYKTIDPRKKYLERFLGRFYIRYYASESFDANDFFKRIENRPMKLSSIETILQQYAEKHNKNQEPELIFQYSISNNAFDSINSFKDFKEEAMRANKNLKKE